MVEQAFSEQAVDALEHAYLEIIQGWARTLDLRDGEPEGHTLRVTERTVQLARAAGLAEAELTYIRIGAILHDIGKLLIPDSILRKPGPLNDREWEQVRLHPVHAYTLLEPIAVLRPALAIPYCHHERWDGKGYPQGLKGTDIPYAARLFAVVDVYDALCSDRPFRPAWSEQQARKHVRSLAGSHLDPAVVVLFFDTL
jgi:HD-GYP domain-containing protein (c-di-GMP phosphodiesterase class II)